MQRYPNDDSRDDLGKAATGSMDRGDALAGGGAAGGFEKRRDELLLLDTSVVISLYTHTKCLARQI